MCKRKSVTRSCMDMNRAYYLELDKMKSSYLNRALTQFTHFVWISSNDFG